MTIGTKISTPHMLTFMLFLWIWEITVISTHALLDSRDITCHTTNRNGCHTVTDIAILRCPKGVQNLAPLIFFAIKCLEYKSNFTH